MKEIYEKVKKVVELIDELSPKILSVLCFHETYRVFCEEYHTKPPYILGKNWLNEYRPPKLRLICDLVILYSYDTINEAFGEISAKCYLDQIIEKMEFVKNMCDKPNEFFMLSIKNGLDERATHKFDFGMLEAEIETEPGERLAMALRVPDPINKLVDTQKQMISYITEFMFTDKETMKIQTEGSNVKLIDFYRFFKSEEEANHMIQDIIRFGSELSEFVRVASL